jgi:hypothetical protein
VSLVRLLLLALRDIADRGWTSGALAKVMPSLPPEQTPTSSQLVAVNPGGTAALANGTYWRVAPKDLARAQQWITGAEITVTPNDVHKPVWPFKLTNEETGEHVAAVQSKPPPK